MDNELTVLIHQIVFNVYSTLQDIINSEKISKRQAMYRINKLNNILALNNIELIEILKDSSNSLHISSKTKEWLKTSLEENKSKETYYFNKEERKICIFMVLFFNFEFVSINDLIDILNTSRSSVFKDLKELTSDLSKEKIELIYNRENGYVLKGNEMNIRRKMMQYVISQLIDSKDRLLFNSIIDYYHLDWFDYSYLLINELAKKYNIDFVDDRLAEFIYVFTFLKERIINGINDDKEIFKIVEDGFFDDMKEYHFTTALLKNYEFNELFSKGETYYLTAWILGVSYGDIYEETKDCAFLAEIVEEIILRFETLCGIHYEDGEKIFTQMYSHFRPAYYRIIFRLPIFNPVKEKIKKEYWELYALTKETLRPFYSFADGDFPDDEIAYLTMHFSSIFDGKPNKEILNQKKAILVCGGGIINSLLNRDLKELFPEILFLEPMNYTEFLNSSHDVDLIFIQGIMAENINLNIPTINVSPMMTVREKYELLQTVNVLFSKKNSSKRNIDDLMSIIKKFAYITDENSLRHGLMRYYSLDNLDEYSEDIQFDLVDIIDERLIAKNVHASNWEEAIRNAYKPLLDNDCITEEYIEDTIKAKKLNGPFMVISKGVALPHTRSDAGAKKLALGITILDKPVEFGSINDPVKYLFPLSCINNNDHIKAMAELINLLSNEEFYKALDNYKDKQEIFDYIKSCDV